MASSGCIQICLPGWEDNVREMTGLELAKSQGAVENREKMEETGCEIINDAPMVLAVN